MPWWFPYAVAPSVGAIWLYLRAARSPSRVIHEGESQDWLSAPRRRAEPPPFALGNRRSTVASTPAVRPGATALTTDATLAGSGNKTSASPRRHAATIRRAADSALIDKPGNASLMLNHAYSDRCSPRKIAFRGLPVRIRPGHTVTTLIRSPASSARRPCEKPTAA